MDKFLFAFICVTGVSLSLGGSYNYIKNDAEGPSNWGGLCQNGTKQSPIDINSTKATEKTDFPAFNLHNYGNTPAYNFTATNSGLSLKVNLPGNVYFVNGGGLTGNYTTAQLHVHWGSSDSTGSEHFVNGKQYAAELHLVSYNVKYGNLTYAVDKSDGLAVLGVLIKVGSANSAYDSVFAAADKLVNASSTVDGIAAFKLSSLLPANTTRFYRYSGSLTTPDCQESVAWTVFADVIQISSAQIAKLRSLKMNSTMVIGHNYRPIQSLGGRTVTVSFKEPAATTSPTGTAPIPTNADDAAAFTKITTSLLLLMLFAAFFFN